MPNREPSITRHRFTPGAGALDCARCPAPERNRRFHPPITWLAADASTDDVRLALGDALADPEQLQPQMEVVLQLLVGRYGRACPLDISALWPGLGLDNRRPIMAALAAGTYLERARALRPALDVRRRPITVTRRIHGRDVAAPIYIATPQGAAL